MKYAAADGHDPNEPLSVDEAEVAYYRWRVATGCSEPHHAREAHIEEEDLEHVGATLGQ